MDDLISKQAAIDAFGLSEKTRKYGGDHSGYDTRMLYEIQDVLEGLPSAQPELAQDLPNACTDAISRQAAIDIDGLDVEIRCSMCENPMHTNKGCNGNCKYDEKLYEKIIQILDERIKPLPSAQPERKKGKWEMLQITINPPVYKCSVCGGHALQTVTGCLINRHLEANLTNFCPNCGADMRGEHED